MSWYTRFSTGKLSLYRRISKVDLHRHLEGSLRLRTLSEIAAQQRIYLSAKDFRAHVQMQPGDPLTAATFLSKFQTLRQFYRSQEIIERLAREVVEDAARDGVVHLELSFTPVALGRVQGFAPEQVMDWVSHSAQEAAVNNNISVKLIASVNRHEPVELAEVVARLAAERIRNGIVGLDLAGNEAQFSALPFSGVFRRARDNGLHITIHAGEWGGPENVREAIEVFDADRICHGVRVMEDPAVVLLALEHGTSFDVCLTSNYQSGVVPSLAAHPLRHMLDAGLRVTLNTDDPSISGISLSDEYIVAHEEVGIDREAISRCLHNSVRAAFLAPDEKEKLFERLQVESFRFEAK